MGDDKQQQDQSDKTEIIPPPKPKPEQAPPK